MTRLYTSFHKQLAVGQLDFAEAPLTVIRLPNEKIAGAPQGDDHERA
ncbi:MAG: hypothetical protein KBC47_05180 [Candidatus Peribacteraceae bacterium]|nr:hypothetical protein [Candidatus Peribacteraceae bacterium]